MEVKRLMLFLGSGVSLPAGLPDAEMLTGKILYCDWFLDGADHIYRSTKTGVLSSSAWPVGLQRFLRELKQQNSTADYEKLFDHCRELSEGQCDPTRDTLIHSLCREIPGNLPLPEEVTPRLIGEEGCRFIQWVVFHSLNISGSTNCLQPVCDLARQLSGRGLGLDIVTLNHDLLVEHAFDSNGVDYRDGFAIPDGSGYWFDSSAFDGAGGALRLFKLHGSINWYLSTKSSQYFLKLPLRATIQHNQDSHGGFFFGTYSDPLFLSGTTAKVLQYDRHPFREIHERWQTALDETDKIVMSG